MTKLSKFVGKQDIEMIEKEINTVKDIFTKICNKNNLSFDIEYDKRYKALRISVKLPYEGLYRHKSTLQTFKVRGSMLFLIYNRKGFVQGELNTKEEWDRFNEQCRNKEEWNTTQFTLKSSVNMSTRDYRHKHWYGSCIETYDYNTNITDLEIGDSITRALDILSRTKRIK